MVKTHVGTSYLLPAFSAKHSIAWFNTTLKYYMNSLKIMKKNMQAINLAELLFYVILQAPLNVVVLPFFEIISLIPPQPCIPFMS